MQSSSSSQTPLWWCLVTHRPPPFLILRLSRSLPPSVHALPTLSPDSLLPPPFPTAHTHYVSPPALVLLPTLFSFSLSLHRLTVSTTFVHSECAGGMGHREKDPRRNTRTHTHTQTHQRKKSATAAAGGKDTQTTRLAFHPSDRPSGYLPRPHTQGGRGNWLAGRGGGGWCGGPLPKTSAAGVVWVSKKSTRILTRICARPRYPPPECYKYRSRQCPRYLRKWEKNCRRRQIRFWVHGHGKSRFLFVITELDLLGHLTCWVNGIKK